MPCRIQLIFQGWMVKCTRGLEYEGGAFPVRLLGIGSTPQRATMAIHTLHQMPKRMENKVGMRVECWKLEDYGKSRGFG